LNLLIQIAFACVGFVTKHCNHVEFVCHVWRL